MAKPYFTRWFTRVQREGGEDEFIPTTNRSLADQETNDGVEFIWSFQTTEKSGFNIDELLNPSSVGD